MHTCKLYMRQYAHDPEPTGDNWYYWYPEAVRGQTVDELIKKAATALRECDAIVSTSEHVLLLAMHLHGKKVINLELYAGLEPVRIDEEGDLIDQYPGGFFMQRADIIFCGAAAIDSNNWESVRRAR